MHAVEGDTAREMLYDRAHFAFGKEVWFAEDIPDGLGFAGFRLREKETWEEWLSFLGAAYFRSPGESGQYGLSARAIAVNTGLAQAEEFPDFTDFWFEHVGDQSQALIIHGLLDGPSVTGAYRIKAWRETGVLMDVDATLFLARRSQAPRLGAAHLDVLVWQARSASSPRLASASA